MKHGGVDYDMSEIETLVERLRGGDEALSGLVERLIDDLLSRPVMEMVEPEWVARQFVEGLRATAQDEHTEAWLHAQVKTALQRSESETGSLSTRLPEELSKPLKQLLRRPYTPNATIVRSLLDHEAMRDLIRTVLVQILTDFGKSIRPALPDAPLGGRRRGGKLSQLVGAAQEVASVVGAQVEERTEAKVREFVDDAISRSLEISVAQLCSESFSDTFGRWRADSVDVLLEVPVETWQREVESLEPEALVGEIVWGAWWSLCCPQRWKRLGIRVCEIFLRGLGLRTTGALRSRRSFSSGRVILWPQMCFRTGSDLSSTDLVFQLLH